eukprot:4112476-Alexandrium_andersonii.AAC.1
MALAPSVAAAARSASSRAFTALSASSSSCSNVAAWAASMSPRLPVRSARDSSAASTPLRALAKRA